MNYCLVSIAKNEHRYMNHWCQYHLKLGFERILIFNNSPVPYNVMLPGVEEYNVSKDKAPQPACYNIALKMLPKDTWVLFIDLDEYLHLEQDKTVADFLNHFPDADIVRLNWKCFGDNEQLHYSPEPVTQRFTVPCEKYFVYNDELPLGIYENSHIKNFVKITDKPIVQSVHNAIMPYGKAVNAVGNPQNMFSPWQDICWEVAWINHYNCKSTEEFCDRRLNTKDVCGSVIANDKLIRFYFNENHRTKEKEEVFEKYLSNRYKDLPRSL